MTTGNQRVTTAHILAYKALNRTCGQDCVDWAIALLEQGRESKHSLWLGGMTPPFNQFEMADLRNRTLKELALPLDMPVDQIASELLRSSIEGDSSLIMALAIIKDLAEARHLPGHLWDFWNLHYALFDLQNGAEQWYVATATPETIMDLIRDRARRHLQDNPPSLASF